MPPQPSPKRLEQYREALRRLQAAHEGTLQDLEENAFSPEHQRFATDNPADTGSDTYAQSFSLELLRRDEAILKDVVAALARLRDGTFGRCGSCEKWIQKARLDEMPWARLCIGCQRRAEGVE